MWSYRMIRDKHVIHIANAIYRKALEHKYKSEEDII